ncbi:MAG: hypothetical protein H2056_06490 [Sphingopyxis sp.]|nr:hypothetical protein [Sphingopyxis sp.]
MRRLILAVWAALMPLALAAQTVVSSAAPDKVSVSVYRDPERDRGSLDLENLSGFALISETRTIDLPAGEADVRFEGVADGMIAVSAIVTGLPGGTVEKNRDAALLSPASLVDGTLGNRVVLRRTSRSTGAVVEERAIVRSSAAGAVVFETAAGLETLRCTGLAETLVYNGVPTGLGARPTFSVRTRSPAATRATVRLTYLATGFDWAAQYVAELSDDGNSADLLVWLTVANSNASSFVDASLYALAGSVNVDSDYQDLGPQPAAPPLQLSCFALDSGRMGGGALVGAPPLMMSPAASNEIVVTGRRLEAKMYDSAAVVAVVAEQENLGDLKLYRVPVPVTVAANAQKQVALLVKQDVPVKRLYQATIYPGGNDDLGLSHLLRIDNRKGKGLAEPLPSGAVAMFETAAGERRYTGASALRDHAVGEEVDLLVGESAQVRLKEKRVGEIENGTRAFQVELTNANAWPVDVEVRFAVHPDDKPDRALNRLPRKDGYSLWKVRVPANGSRTFDYRAAE